MDAYDIFHKKDELWEKMYQNNGSVYKVYEWCAKQAVDSRGEKPVFVKPEVPLNKKRSIN
jgi:hypothetical protein